MGKSFNAMQKERRAQISNRKRALHGDPATGKLKRRNQPQSLSGKNKQKLLRKWRRDQKEAVDKGLLTMEDVEMAAADNPGSTKSGKKKFHLKRSLKIKAAKKKKSKAKSESSPGVVVASADAMVE